MPFKLFRRATFALLLASLLVYSCQREVFEIVEPATGPIIPAPTQQLISTTIQGQVFDENGAMLPGAIVKINGQVKQSDEFGLFRFENTSINKNGGVISVSKAGYFSGYRSMIYKESATNLVTIQLLKRDLAGTIDAAAGGDAKLGKIAVTLAANSIVKASDNSAYSGQVKVYTAYLDPENRNITRQMPGNLLGIDTRNNLAGLETYGMLAVELESPAGETLQLKSSAPATITIPASAKAPPTIPLWYYDATNGFWKEEGTATKTGSNYVGTVSHFSFWNCDAPFPLVEFEASFADQAGAPLQNYQVGISATGKTNFLSGSGYTDSTGFVKGLIPYDEALTLTVYGECGAMFTKNIGPYTAKTTLEKQTVTLPGRTTLTGVLEDCNKTPVSNGYASLITNGKLYRSATDATGKFSIMFSNCSNATSGVLAGYDFGSLQEGQSATISFTSNTVDAGTITACGTIMNEFFTFNIDKQGETTLIPALDSFYVNVQDTLTTIQAFKKDHSKGLSIWFAGEKNTVGAMRLMWVSSERQYYSAPDNTMVNITGFGNFIEGNFNGNVSDSGRAVPVSFSFKVKQ